MPPHQEFPTRRFPVCLPACLLLLLAGGLLPAAAQQEDYRERHVRFFEKMKHVTIGITCETSSPRMSFYGTGTVITPDGFILTNTTVAPEGARDIRIYYHGGRLARATQIGVDEETEVSILKIEAEEHPHAPLSEADELDVGTFAYTMGDAKQGLTEDSQLSMSVGVVSGLYDVAPRPEDDDYQSTYRGTILETSAAVNPGDDGGPVLDLHGRLIGLLSLAYSPSRWLGTAIPVWRIRPAVERLVEKGRGVAVTGEAWIGFSLKPRGGQLVVTRVTEGGPADRAGVRVGDVLLRFGQIELEDIHELKSLLRLVRPGARIALVVLRGSERLRVLVTLGKSRGV